MTLTEKLIATALLAFGVFAAMLGTAQVREELKREQTWSLLAMLDEALDVYHAHAGRWPVEAPTTPPDVDRSADALQAGARGTAFVAVDLEAARDVLEALAAEPASRRVLDRVPPVLTAHRPNESAWGVHDGWGRPLACLTPRSPNAAHRLAVEANGGKPIFLSAGPDGRFGHGDPTAAADNLMRRPEPHAPDARPARPSP